MKTLSDRNAVLLCYGAKMLGSFSEGFMYCEEELYIDEIDELRLFCQWIDEKIGGGAEGNIKNLFIAFKEPNNKNAQEFANKLKLRIAEIRSHAYS